MRPPREAKWTAFLLSLAVPGTGQLFAMRLTAVLWFAATGLTVAACVTVAERTDKVPPQVLSALALLVLGIVSAEEAKRYFERSCPAGRGKTVGQPRVRARRPRGRALSVEMEIDFAMPVAQLWGEVSHLTRFLSIDPFHDRVVLMRPLPRAGVDLVLHHNAFGWRFARFGRILTWRENEGYAFSDLSKRNKFAGFPHVFCVSVGPRMDARSGALAGSRLTISVRGKWTSKWIPVSVGSCWVGRVCREHARLIRKAL